MADHAAEQITELLTGAVDDLDLPANQQDRAHAIYDDVGTWLTNHLGSGDWFFYPQGSMRLGTVVPPSDDDEYDIDAVARLSVDRTVTTQEDLKSQVGKVLDSYVEARRDDEKIRAIGCSAGRRCWTLDFDAPFHMDVLPAIPDPDHSPTGILLADRDLRFWQPGDPIAYSEWFYGRMEIQVREVREAMAKAAKVDIEDVPTWHVKTTLQRLVQVLKVHRNRFFAEDPDSRPTSIVLTTLAAVPYRGGSLFDAVMEAVALMPDLIDRDGGEYVVLNPVQDEENFAERWTDETYRSFTRWISSLQATLERGLRARGGLNEAVAILGEGWGERSVRKSAERYGLKRTELRRDGRLAVTTAGGLTATGTGVRVRDHVFDGE